MQFSTVARMLSRVSSALLATFVSQTARQAFGSHTGVCGFGFGVGAGVGEPPDPFLQPIKRKMTNHPAHPRPMIRVIRIALIIFMERLVN